MTVRWDEDILKDRRTIVIYNISKLVRSEVGGGDWWKRGKSRVRTKNIKISVNRRKQSRQKARQIATWKQMLARVLADASFLSLFFSSDQLISWSINHEERILYVTNETK